MAAPAGRPNTALLVVDVQNAVVVDAHERDAVVANIATLVERARASGTPVVWVQHANDDDLAHGSDGWHIVAELEPAADDPAVEKRYGDAFEATELGDILERLDVGRLVVAGAQTDACIRSTLHGAFVRGYDTILVGDAHTTSDRTDDGAPPVDGVVAHTNLYWRYQDGPGRTAGVVSTAEADFGAR